MRLSVADDQGGVAGSCAAGNAAGKNGLIANRHHGADRTAAGRNGFLAVIETGVTDPGCAGNAAAADNLRSAGDQGTDGRAALADGRGAAARKIVALATPPETSILPPDSTNVPTALPAESRAIDRARTFATMCRPPAQALRQWS